MKPSWALVADADKIINPDLERFYAVRAHSHAIELEGASHSVYELHPKEVAALIDEAARKSPNYNSICLGSALIFANPARLPPDRSI